MISFKTVFAWCLIFLFFWLVSFSIDSMEARNDERIERDSFLLEFCKSKGYDNWSTDKSSFVVAKLYCYRYELDGEGIGKIMVRSNIFYYDDVMELN